MVQDCPHWPKWKIIDAQDVLKHLGDGVLEFYDMEFGLWIESPTMYPHSVTTDSYLLLRCKDVECQDFDKHLKSATQ